MYAIIKGMDPVRNVYRQQLLNEGVPEDTLKAIDDETI